jgi:hypothetical protein
MLQKITEKLCFVAFLVTAAGVVALVTVAIMGVPAECAKCPSICCLGIKVACCGELGLLAIVGVLAILTGRNTEITGEYPSELPYGTRRSLTSEPVPAEREPETARLTSEANRLAIRP